jgi:hypothetical protein
MVQLSPNITVEPGKAKGDEAAAYLESIVNAHAKQGWEFYRIDSIGATAKPGSLEYYIATFRAPV